MAKMYSLTIRNRAAAALFGVAVIGVGAVFLTLGFALLLGLVVAGAVLGAGLAGVRLLRGGRGATARMNLDELRTSQSPRISGLDPQLEVKPIAPAIVRPRDEND